MYRVRKRLIKTIKEILYKTMLFTRYGSFNLQKPSISMILDLLARHESYYGILLEENNNYNNKFC